MLADAVAIIGTMVRQICLKIMHVTDVLPRTWYSGMVAVSRSILILTGSYREVDR